MKREQRMSKLKRLRRIFELVAKWASIALGTLIIGTCSAAGVAYGSSGGVLVVALGLVVGLALVGWVFAVARLNADVKALRKEVDARTPADAPAAGTGTSA
jgi:hypothetical protein